jgi:hypothetical protein
MIASSIIEKILITGLSKQHPEIVNKLQVMCEDTSYFHALFLGSSRTLYGVNTVQLENLTGKRVFNAGIEGAGIDEIYLAFSSYLSRHPAPECIYLMLDLHSFSATKDLPIYTLYYAQFLQQKILRKELAKIIGAEVELWYYLPFTLLPQFSENSRSEALKGLLHAQRSESKFYHGFSPLNQKFSIASHSTLNQCPDVKADKLQVLYLLLEQAKSKSIKVKLYEGPYLKSFTESTEASKAFKILRDRIKVSAEVQHYITFEDSMYFKDETHLNALGAEKYSEVLATEL